MTDRDFQEFVIKHMTELSGEVKEIRQSQARMEFELTEKISAISEAQKVTDEKLENLTKNNILNFEFMVNTMDYVANKIDHVAADTAMLVNRVTRLEKTSK